MPDTMCLFKKKHSIKTSHTNKKEVWGGDTKTNSLKKKYLNVHTSLKTH